MTRVTDHSATCIDFIYQNIPEFSSVVLCHNLCIVFIHNANKVQAFPNSL